MLVGSYGLRRHHTPGGTAVRRDCFSGWPSTNLRSLRPYTQGDRLLRWERVMPKLRVFAALALIGISLLAFGIGSLMESGATEYLVKSGFESP